MFEKEYEQKSDGSWVEWSEDIWGNKRARRCVPPQRVIDCARYHHCRRVWSDGWETKPMDSPVVEVVIERRRPVVVVEHRRTNLDTAAEVGSLLGGLIGEALRKRKQAERAEPEPTRLEKKTRRGKRGR